MTDMDVLARLMAKVSVTESGCWEWQGLQRAQGYGVLKVRGRNCATHRVAYELMVGPIGDSVVRHDCDNPPCLNPSHLRLGTHRDNVLDMYDRARRYEGGHHKPVCKRGHAREGANLRGNTCVACYNITRREWRARQIGEPNAANKAGK